MPNFTTISPTCKSGAKPQAWDRFRTGGYIAIGWCYKTDLTGMSIDEILEMIPRTSNTARDELDGLHSFPVFWRLCCGDYVAVKNVNHGLFGVGIVQSGYKYSRYKHDTGMPDHFYPHYLDVEWVWTDDIPTKSLTFGDEMHWRPYGTMGQLNRNVPSYILPFLRGSPSNQAPS